MSTKPPRPAPYTINRNIPELKHFLTGIKPRLLLRNLPAKCTQAELTKAMGTGEVVAVEFLSKNDNTPAGAAVVEFETFEALEVASQVDGKEMDGMVVWAVNDKDGIRSLSFLRSLGHKMNQRPAPPRPKPTPPPPTPTATAPDLDMVNAALKLAAKIDLSQLAQLKEAVEIVQSTPPQVDDYKQRSVKVRNLPRTASTIRLQQIFNGCGSIEHITAQNQRGEVIIRYATPDEADLAVRFYNGRRMDGKKLQVLYRNR